MNAEEPTPLFRAVSDFIRYLAIERGLSENYQVSVRASLEGFAKWLAKERQVNDPEAIQFSHLSSYLAVRKKDGLAPGSMKLIIVALKIFFRFLCRQKLIPLNIAETLTLPRITLHLPETLNELQVERLIESVPVDQPLGLRDRAILELLYASGLRISELTGARLERLDLENGLIRITGKGNKTRLVPVGKKAREAIADYLKDERPRLVKKTSGSHLFLSVRGGKLTSQRCWQILKKRARQCGLEPSVYPHLMRHSFATHLLSNGADLRVIQELLGHADISTTQVYTRVDSQRLKNIHHRFHPRSTRQPKGNDAKP